MGGGTRKRVRARSLLIGGAACLALLALSYAGAVALSHREESRSRQEWNDSQADLDQLVARYPHRDRSAAAEKLTELAVGLGIDFAPRWDDNARQPDVVAREQYTAVGEALHSYLRQIVEGEDPSIPAPPVEVAEYLARHASQLTRLRRSLGEGPTPFWIRELDRGVGARLPNLVGQLNLQRLLLADALAQMHDGRRDVARGDLEASWKMGQALAEDPILIVQLVRTAVSRLQVGVLRHVPVDAELWRGRLESLRDTSVFLDALRFEVAVFSTMDPTRLLHRRPWWEKAAAAVAAPYLRLCAAEELDRWRAALEWLEQRQSFCPPAGASTLNLKLMDKPWWNHLTESNLPSILGAANRISTLQLDAELTRHWLLLSATREQSGAWPAQLPLPAESAACPGERWTYSQHSGGAEIHFSREFSRPRAGLVLPLRFAANGSL